MGLATKYLNVNHTKIQNNGLEIKIIKTTILLNIILNSVRQHNYFITQGNYIGYMFRLYISHRQAYFCHLSHKMLCTLWDPIVFASMDVNTMGTQSVHSVL